MSPRKGIRYPGHVVAQARALRAEGRSLEHVARILRERHDAPSLQADTVLRWCDPAYADRVNRRQAERHGREHTWTFRVGRRTSSEAYQAAFVRRLRDEGVPTESVIRVCRVVFAEPFSAREIRRQLSGATA